jgi:nitrogen-specific signal transduction histidine kinase
VWELDPSLPRRVLLDKIRFSQLIMNLASNAAKVKKRIAERETGARMVGWMVGLVGWLVGLCGWLDGL